MRRFGFGEHDDRSPARPAPGTPAVRFEDVHKAFGSNRVLNGLTMEIPEGKITMIMGPSGTGKSVCISHMVGLMSPDSGVVQVEGESLEDMDDDALLQMRKDRFGVLFQDGALFSSMTVADNVAFPLVHNTDKADVEIDEIVHRRLAEVGLAGSGSLKPNVLS